MFKLLAIASMIASASSQQILCRSQTCPSIGGMCPQGYTIITSGECCLSTDCYTDSTCADKLNSRGENECPGMIAYCNNSLYRSLMQDQCPKTCNFCSATSTSPPTCVDKVNPNTGRSDCVENSGLCNNSLYRDLMRQECPKTCNFC